MPRLKQLNLPGIPQHVKQRGNNRQAVFFIASDYRLYLDMLAKGRFKSQIEVALKIRLGDGKQGRPTKCP